MGKVTHNSPRRGRGPGKTGRMVHLSVRIPIETKAFFAALDDPSEHLRKALENYIHDLTVLN